MNDDPRKAELGKIIAEWKKKHRVRDNDPLMATLELWQVLVENSRAADPGQLFHHELEQLTGISKAFSKQTNELTVELRKVSRIKHELWLFPYFTVILSAVTTLIIGIFIGRFLLLK